jgi:predicted AlkP superfamily pyrophosphatase or phosphodiesterase
MASGRQAAGRRWRWGLALLLAPLLGGAALPPAAAQESGRRSLVVLSVDGLRPACYTRPDAEGLAIPNLRSLVARGAWADGVVGILPTVTYPSHTTLLTGVTPRVHGIESNRVFDPEGQSGDAWNWYAKHVRVPTLVSAARAKGLSTATVWWPVSVGIGSDWNFPEFWRPGSQSPVDLDLLAALSTPGLLDAVAADQGRPFAYPITDDERLATALYLLKSRRPDVTFLHLVAVDFASHDFGPGSPQAHAAVEETDARIGRLLATLAETGMADRTLLAIVSDHGFLPVSRSLQPNSVLRDAGLVSVDAQGRIVGWRAVFHSDGGSAGLVLRDPGDAAVVAQVRALFQPRLKDPRSGLRAILGEEEIAALGGTSRWRLLLDAREGFNFAPSAAGPWEVASRKRGDHGYCPDRPELYASLVLAGPGLAKAGDLGVVHMTAVAPTLARYLGLELAPEADAPLPVW